MAGEEGGVFLVAADEVDVVWVGLEELGDGEGGGLGGEVLVAVGEVFGLFVDFEGGPEVVF